MYTSLLSFTTSLILILWPVQNSHGLFIFSWHPLQTQTILLAFSKLLLPLHSLYWLSHGIYTVTFVTSIITLSLPLHVYDSLVVSTSTLLPLCQGLHCHSHDVCKYSHGLCKHSSLVLYYSSRLLHNFIFSILTSTVTLKAFICTFTGSTDTF